MKNSTLLFNAISSIQPTNDVTHYKTKRKPKHIIIKKTVDDDVKKIDYLEVDTVNLSVIKKEKIDDILHRMSVGALKGPLNDLRNLGIKQQFHIRQALEKMISVTMKESYADNTNYELQNIDEARIELMAKFVDSEEKSNQLLDLFKNRYKFLDISFDFSKEPETEVISEIIKLDAADLKNEEIYKRIMFHLSMIFTCVKKCEVKTAEFNQISDNMVNKCISLTEQNKFSLAVLYAYALIFRDKDSKITEICNKLPKKDRFAISIKLRSFMEKRQKIETKKE